MTTPQSLPAFEPTTQSLLRRAATVVVLREGEAGMEVLLLQRSARPGDIHSGACVFPGGVVDPADREAHAACAGIDDAQASARLGLAEGALDYHVAALRECFEEAGLLFAQTAEGGEPDADTLRSLAAQRGALHRGEVTMQQVCQRFGLQLAAGRLAYIAHWLTPAGLPKRYDTRFFVAAAPRAQVAEQDHTETVAQLWLSPADALARARELRLAPPTFKTLQWLQGFGRIDAVMAAAQALGEVPCITPRLATGSQGLRPVMPDEPAFAELQRLQSLGEHRYELTPGPAVKLSDRLLRVTAPNGSMMTGPGTNTYLIGGGPANEWAVLDPGPDDESHVQAILAAAPGPIRWIFVTHTHKDHSPAAVALKARTGATVLGMPPLHSEWQDSTFAPDQALRGGEVFALPGGSTWRAIHTPGHAGNHLCYWLEEERMLFTGDHVMQGSTVVINPPDGSMGAYLQSLRSLLALDIDWLAPGHGFLMPRPAQAMEQIIQHRLKREAKVHAALPAQGTQPLDALLPVVYADTPPKLHAMARRSLLAHLHKLRDDGLAHEAPAEHWGRAA